MSAAPPKLRRAVPGDVAGITDVQHAAYAKNRALLGVEPLPLMVDYKDILRDYEVWVGGPAGALDAVLVLLARADDLLIWSVASAPHAQGAGLGNTLLGFAERRALEQGRKTQRLYTGEKLRANVEWYQRRGYRIERTERLSDRTIVHLIKTLDRGD